jgi:hypothetical protein
MELQNSNSANSENSVSDFNLLYERIVQYLKNSAFLPLSNYTSFHLKRMDHKLFTSEDMGEIINVFNHLRSHYINQINSEIQTFIDKYNLKEKLKIKSEVWFYEMLMKELNISLKDLEQIEEINSLSNDDSNILKYYLNKYTNERNTKLEDENAKLKIELENLRNKNKLNL